LRLVGTRVTTPSASAAGRVGRGDVGEVVGGRDVEEVRDGDGVARVEELGRGVVGLVPRLVGDVDELDGDCGPDVVGPVVVLPVDVPVGLVAGVRSGPPQPDHRSAPAIRATTGAARLDLARADLMTHAGHRSGRMRRGQGPHGHPGWEDGPNRADHSGVTGT
jgi:hypothetical protein